MAVNRKISKIVASGRANLMKTEEYRQQVTLIKKEIGLKYRDKIKSSKNLIHKIHLHIQMHIEIRREVEKLASYGKMYVSS